MKILLHFFEILFHLFKEIQKGLFACFIIKHSLLPKFKSGMGSNSKLLGKKIPPFQLTSIGERLKESQFSNL